MHAELRQLDAKLKKAHHSCSCTGGRTRAQARIDILHRTVLRSAQASRVFQGESGWQVLKLLYKTSGDRYSGLNVDSLVARAWESSPVGFKAEKSMHLRAFNILGARETPPSSRVSLM